MYACTLTQPPTARTSRLLKREHLDLRITPYQVLPTSSSDGLIQFVPSVPLARLLADHRSIHRFLAMHHPDPKGESGVVVVVWGGGGGGKQGREARAYMGPAEGRKEGCGLSFPGLCVVHVLCAPHFRVKRGASC